MPKRNIIPIKIQKLIYQEAGSKCAICDEENINTLEIHHIYDISSGGGNEPENLILVCANCHNKITNNEITRNDVLKIKYLLLNKSKSEKGKEKQSSIINLNKSINTGIIAQTINIKQGSSKKIKMNYPDGCIGSDLLKRIYIKRLIDRYNEFKKADRHIESFKYQIIYGSIKREFKCNWDFIPSNRFDELVLYLQNRIDKTILGRNNKSQGKKNYSTYEEFLESQVK